MVSTMKGIWVCCLRIRVLFLKREERLNFSLLGGTVFIRKILLLREVVVGGCKGMTSSQCCLSCSNSWGQWISRSSHGSGSREVGIIFICNCGDITVIKMTKTSKNGVRQFRGFHHYRVLWIIPFSVIFIWLMFW